MTDEVKKERYDDGILDAQFFNTKVSGVTFEGRQEIIATLTKGDKLLCLRDRYNKYDKNAVKVVLQSDTSVSIGFLNKDLAAKLSPVIDNGTKYAAVITDITGQDKGNLGVNIRVVKLFTRRKPEGKQLSL